MSTQNKLPLFLRIFQGGKLLDVKQFTTTQIVIGSDPGRDLVIQDSDVAPIHAMIEEREGGRFFLCDLGSKSGTFLHGHKVVDQAIASGSEFQVGSFTIEFHLGIPKPKKAPPTGVPIADKSEAPQSVAPKKDLPKAPIRPSVSASAVTASFGADMVTEVPKQRANYGTYAPSTSADLDKVVKPESGPVLQIILSWHDRVLNAFHYDDNRLIHVGSHPDNDIILPVVGSLTLKHPIVKMENGSVAICLTDSMTGEVVRNKSTVKFDELKRQGKLNADGVNYAYQMEQSELVRVHFGEGVSLTISFVKLPPPTRLVPFIDLTTNQMLGLGLGLVAALLFSIFAILFPPKLDEDIKDELEPPKIAKFYYPKKEALDLSKPDAVAANSAPETIKDKENAPRRGEEGASQDAPKVEKETNKRVQTAKKAGTDKKATIQKAENAKAAAAPKAPPKKDISKQGVLSVFGKQGMQDRLNKAFQGTGAVAGMSEGATGSGAEAAGSGYDPGAGLRDVGKGGKGTATTGISGVQTKGKGGGLTGYGTGGLGAKKFANIVAGDAEATVEGSIDKEAIRRVIQRNINQIRNCYERGLNRDPSLYGKIVIQWTIGAGGRVTAAGTKTTTMNSKIVEECCVRQLRSWKFPEPPAGQEAEVSYPFVFQAQE